ncbi:DMT family transporter [Agilicoccus flavus]|uniref:DMT family transporter n=1 Tax=Agilicoccus flavus TaxID=2775968 RepID=UPI001CF69260|nr:DMT family transporter [Agilicoccus flavus]
MGVVILLAVASTTAAAVSTVLKHLSANRPPRPVGPGAGSRLLRRLPNRLFLLALVVDAAAVTFQVFALRAGDLSTVQPVLTLALVISLGLDHLVARTRIRRSEALWAATLLAGLVLFLVAADAAHPRGRLEVGRRDIGIGLALAAAALWLPVLAITRRARRAVRARVLAVGVAAIYACTAALITSSTRIVDRFGPGELLASWQLWTLLASALLGVWLNQRAFAMAPLHVTLPVIASLDPLFSVVIGRFVFDERLRSTPGATVLEVVGLGLLLLGVARLSRSQAVAEAAAAPTGRSGGP